MCILYCAGDGGYRRASVVRWLVGSVETLAFLVDAGLADRTRSIALWSRSVHKYFDMASIRLRMDLCLPSSFWLCTHRNYSLVAFATLIAGVAGPAEQIAGRRGEAEAEEAVAAVFGQ